MESNRPTSVKPKVILLGYTQSINGQGPESLVAAAGKLCYSKSDIISLTEQLSDEDIENLFN